MVPIQLPLQWLKALEGVSEVHTKMYVFNHISNWLLMSKKFSVCMNGNDSEFDYSEHRIRRIYPSGKPF